MELNICAYCKEEYDPEFGECLLADMQFCCQSCCADWLDPPEDDDDFDSHLGCANWPNCDTEGCGEH